MTDVDPACPACGMRRFSDCVCPRLPLREFDRDQRMSRAEIEQRAAQHAEEQDRG